jgi:hypothetical protein
MALVRPAQIGLAARSRTQGPGSWATTRHALTEGTQQRMIRQ